MLMEGGVFVAEESLTDGSFPQGTLIIDLTVDDLVCIADVESAVVDVAEGTLPAGGGHVVQGQLTYVRLRG